MSNLNKQYDTFCKQILARLSFLLISLNAVFMNSVMSMSLSLPASVSMTSLSIRKKSIVFHLSLPSLKMILRKKEKLSLIFSLWHICLSVIRILTSTSISKFRMTSIPAILYRQEESTMAAVCFPCSMRIRSKVPVMKISRRSIRSGSA